MYIGIYIDFDSVAPYGMGSCQFAPIREYFEACGDVLHMLAFMGRDEAHESVDAKFTGWRRSCRARFEDAGCRVIDVPGQMKSLEGAGMNIVADCTVPLTVQVMLHSDRLDRVVLVTNNPAYERLCDALRDKGLYVDLLHTRPIPELQRAASKALNPLLIPGVFWAKDQTFKQVVRVRAYDRVQKLLHFEYLERMPKSLSAKDAAWQTKLVGITSSHLEVRKAAAGAVLGWTGGSESYHFHDLNQ